MDNKTVIFIETTLHEIQRDLQLLGEIQYKHPRIFKEYQPYINEIAERLNPLIDDEFDKLFPVKEKTESQKFRDRFYSKFEGKGAHRNTDPETSVKAAKSVKATKLEGQVLDELLKREKFLKEPFVYPADIRGMTSEEVALSLDREFDCITPRFAPLLRKELIEKSGITRKGKSGHGRIVWVLTEKGREDCGRRDQYNG
jgi:hypothetical protein